MVVCTSARAGEWRSARSHPSPSRVNVPIPSRSWGSLRNSRRRSRRKRRRISGKIGSFSESGTDARLDWKNIRLNT